MALASHRFRASPLVLAILLCIPALPAIDAASPPVAAVNARTSEAYAGIQAALDDAAPGDVITVPMSADAVPTPHVGSLVLATQDVTLCATVALGACAPISAPGRFELNGLAFAEPPTPWQQQAMKAATGVGSTSYFPKAFLGNEPLQIDDIEALSADFLVESGSCTGGSRRIQLGLDTDGNGARDTTYMAYPANGTPCVVGEWSHIDFTKGHVGSGATFAGAHASALELNADYAIVAVNAVFDGAPAGSIVWLDNVLFNDVVLREQVDMACLDAQDPKCPTVVARPATILDGAAGEPTTVLIAATGVTVQGFTIKNSPLAGRGQAVRMTTAGALLENDIEGNLLATDLQFGVLVTTAASPEPFVIEGNRIANWSNQGVYVGGSANGAGIIRGNVITANGANALLVEGDRPTTPLLVEGNDLRANPGNVRMDTSRVVTLRENDLGISQTTLSFTARFPTLFVDATDNRWGTYNRSNIMATMSGVGARTVDVSCYYSLQDTQVCPATADFTFAPATAHKGVQVQFTDASTPGGNKIASYAWDFADGATSSQQSPAHAFPSSGVHLVRLTVTDTEGFASVAQKPVAISNAAPVFDDAGPISATEAQTLVLALSATDADGDALTYTYVSGPAGVAVSGATATWRPTAAQTGAHALVFRASDGDLNDVANVTVNVADVDQTPRVLAAATLRVLEGATSSVMVFTSDADGDAITLAAAGLPAFAELVPMGADAWRIVAAPLVGDRGTYPVVLTATANGVDATTTVNIIVARNAAVKVNVSGSALGLTSPGVPVTLRANVQNTGSESDTFALFAPAPAGWTLAFPAPVTLAPGETQVVAFTATPTTSAREAGLRLVVASAADPAVTGVASYRVGVPIFVTATYTKATYALGETPAGTARVTYLDGSPVVNARVIVKQVPQNAPVLPTTTEGRTDANGVLAFTHAGQTSAMLPGNHAVSVQAVTTVAANIATSYTVGV